MPKLIDVTDDGRFLGLFVGQSGSGKTVAEASFPKPIHFNDFDGRIRGIMGATWIDRGGITYDYYAPKDPTLITEINKKLEAILTAFKINQPIPATYVTDSITNQTYAFLCQAMPLTHFTKTQDGKDKQKGKWIGPISMAGPEDYGLEAQATYDYISFLKSLPIKNVIVSAHIVDRYGKADPNNEYSESVVIGEKLSIRDKIGVNIQTHFDHVFKFDRETVNNIERFYVTFRGGIARTSFANLPGGRFDITGKNFYEFMMNMVKGEK